MTKDERANHTYLGDGVYAEFDGYGIWLRTGDHRDSFCDAKIYIDPDVLYSLNGFFNYIKASYKKESVAE